MESINTQLDFAIGGSKASVTVSNGFINTSAGQMHSHPFYEIHFIIYGENKVRYPNESFYANTGDVLIVPPKLNHCFIPIDNKGEHKRAAFWLDINIVDVSRSDHFVFDTLYNLKKIIQIKDNFDVFQTVEEVQRELIEKKPCYEEILIHIFAKLMIQICRSIEKDKSHGKQTKRSHQSLMLLIDEYIQNHYKEGCSLEEMAEYLHISRRQLTRMIRTLYSKSFRQMLLEHRMSMANWFIEEKNISFEAIAFEVGYGSLASFYHAYLKFYNYTPGEHRKLHRSIDT